MKYEPQLAPYFEKDEMAKMFLFSINENPTLFANTMIYPSGPKTVLCLGDSSTGEFKQTFPFSFPIPQEVSAETALRTEAKSLGLESFLTLINNGVLIQKGLEFDGVLN